MMARVLVCDLELVSIDNHTYGGDIMHSQSVCLLHSHIDIKSNTYLIASLSMLLHTYVGGSGIHPHSLAGP